MPSRRASFVVPLDLPVRLLPLLPLCALLDLPSRHPVALHPLFRTAVPYRPPQPRDVLRYNLLKIPPLRRFLRSSLWPDDINFK